MSDFSIRCGDTKISFRNVLVNKCQDMFKRCMTISSAIDPDAPIGSLINVTKETATGCMIFIGELGNHDVLSNKIVHSCLNIMISKIEKERPQYITDCVFFLIKTTGNDLYTKSPRDLLSVIGDVEQAIVRAKQEDIGLSNKEKFSLMDTVDLKKKNKWV